jgi:hypothetical protein
MKEICKVKGCNEIKYIAFLCKKHYQKQIKKVDGFGRFGA